MSEATFTVDAARALPGPAWLRERRTAAAERALAMPLPSPEEEVWRYSRVAELDLDAYRPEPDPTPVTAIPDAILAEADSVPDRAAVVVVVNGRIAYVDASEPGLLIGPLNDPDAYGAVLGDEPHDAFMALNEAFCADPVVVRIPPGAVIDRPIVVVHYSDRSGLAVFPRLVVQAGADSQATVVDIHTSAPGARVLSVPVAAIAVAPGARLSVLGAQDLGLDAWHIASQVSEVESDATFLSGGAGFGGDYARQRTDCRLVGRGATGDLIAIYFGEGHQTLDFRTFQDHAAPDTTSNLLFKGAVGGHSRSVYTGMIRVRKQARGTNALQTNRNIKLSDHAWAESVPNLEIENNDVRCSHASAVGPIDDDQRFYLESRGVPTPVAERLVVTGFFDEVLERLPVPSAAAALRRLVAGKLARREEEE